ncbi:glycosyltransferase [Bosea sp. TND4EK4]|uniref:glycosyltransferase n=1 Tax=Bosea sp. TND4EK4 TaxID=1907408 RepID=UPI000953CC8D|nr:glycosyltransferase [Bosea sp. TND4EK4]SIR60893.1 glycosyltransferase, MGT family [Bosea sp. TND4EK4]
MIVVLTTPAMGHVKPMMPLLAGLVGKGQKVACFGHGAFEGTIRATGAEFLPYPEVAYDIDAPDFNLVQMGADLIRTSQTIYPAILPRVAALSPRLILQDFMALWGSRIGTTLGTPRVHTIPTIVFNREAERRMRREDGIVKLAGDVLRGLPALASAMIQSKFAISVREAYGLEASWRNLSPPARELVFFLRELQVGNPDGDVPRFYIGPTVNAERRFQPPPFAPGYALVTFGTLSNNQTERFEAAIRGAFQAGMPVVAQCGRKVDLAHLRALARDLTQSHPGRVVEIVESVPDMEALIMGAKIVIHHAGMATTWETARFRKPALFIPTIADQKVLASQLDSLGIGRRLTAGRECDADAIAGALGPVRALSPDWDEVACMLARAGGADRGVELILELLEEHG